MKPVSLDMQKLLSLLKQRHMLNYNCNKWVLIFMFFYFEGDEASRPHPPGSAADDETDTRNDI